MRMIGICIFLNTAFAVLYFWQNAGDEQEVKITENYHLEDVSPLIKQLYNKIKSFALKLDKNLIFNPQKYYISIRSKKNIAYIKFRSKKLRILTS